MASAEFVDPYIDPTTGILRNLAGVSTWAELAQAEGDLVVPRLIRLERPEKFKADLSGLVSIHKFLFADLFDWAGQIRTVDIRKPEEGSVFFLPVSFIWRAAGYSADELAADNWLKGLTRREFIESLAHHYDQWNYIHPFREGNGRAQRVFWSWIAEAAGWLIDWTQVLGAVNDEASRLAADTRDLTALIEMFDQVVRPTA
ncbi:MAG: Fic family protein [Propionibacteriaceae bacterium]|jgi:cell filamentation protein|nr:Fic family protein [Propionibacteriaceae bacterium]